MPEAPATVQDRPGPQLDPVFVSPVEAARLLGLSRSQVYRLLNNGEIEGTHHGGRRLVLYTSLRTFIANLPSPT